MSLWCSQMGVGGWAAMIALWAALLAVVIWAVCRVFPTRHPRVDLERDPRPVLDARRASGEVDPETHRPPRSRLDHSPPVTTGGQR